MIRLGLCCKFLEQSIKFRTTTITHLLKLKEERFPLLSQLLMDNAEAFELAIACCAELGIGAFRINSCEIWVFGTSRER